MSLKTLVLGCSSVAKLKSSNGVKWTFFRVKKHWQEWKPETKQALGSSCGVIFGLQSLLSFT